MKSQIENIFNNLPERKIVTLYHPKNTNYINIDINTFGIVINSENKNLLDNIFKNIEDIEDDEDNTHKNLLLKLLEEYPEEVKISVLEPSYLRLFKNIATIPFAYCIVAPVVGFNYLLKKFIR